MSFGITLKKVNKNGFNLTYPQYELIDNIIRYNGSEWLKHNYENAEIYARKRTGYADIPIPSDNIIQSFSSKKRGIFTEMGSWYGDSTNYFWSMMRAAIVDDKPPEKNDNYCRVTYPKAIQLLASVIEEIDKTEMIPVKIAYSYRKKEEENGTISFISTECDGIEVSTDDDYAPIPNFSRRIDREWGENQLFISKTHYPLDKVEALIGLRNIILDLLKSTNFNKEDVYLIWG